MNGCEMATAVEAREVNGIEAVSLTAITRLSGDQRRGDDLAVEAVVFEHPVQDKAGAGSLSS